MRRWSSFDAGTPVELFEGEDDWYSGNITGYFFAVAPDAQRFMMARQATSAAPPGDEEAPAVRAVLVDNFIEELRSRVPVGR